MGREQDNFFGDGPSEAPQGLPPRMGSSFRGARQGGSTTQTRSSQQLAAELLTIMEAYIKACVAEAFQAQPTANAGLPPLLSAQLEAFTMDLARKADQVNRRREKDRARKMGVYQAAVAAPMQKRGRGRPRKVDRDADLIRVARKTTAMKSRRR